MKKLTAQGDQLAADVLRLEADDNMKELEMELQAVIETFGKTLTLRNSINDGLFQLVNRDMQKHRTRKRRGKKSSNTTPRRNETI